MLYLKDDAKFNYETDGDKKGLLTVTVTATDGGGLKTTGKFSIKIMDVTEPEEEEEEEETAEEPVVPGLKDDSDDGDDDGPVEPPEDGGAFLGDGTVFDIGDDLLGSYVLAIDDIDIA